MIKIMKPLIDDLKTLETEGVDVSYNGDNFKLKGTITYFCSDNLAGNGVGGYIESFGCNIDCKYLKNNNNPFTKLYSYMG